MIGESTLDSGYGSSLALSTTSAANLRKAGKWARFIGIFGLVIMGLTVIGLLFFGGTLLSLDSAGGGLGAGLMLLFYLPFVALGVYLVYLQYNFGSKAMEAVDNQSPQSMEVALASLSRYYKISGILLMVYLVLMVLGLIGMVIGGMAFLGS